MNLDRIDEIALATATFLLAIGAMIVHYTMLAMWPITWFIGALAIVTGSQADRAGRPRRLALEATNRKRLP